MNFSEMFKKKEEDFEWEPLPNFTSLDNAVSWSKKYLSESELEEAKEKLFNILCKDLRITPSIAKLCVNHVIAIKAMRNAGYSREYMSKLLITKKLVQELHDTKLRLKQMNKNYARASNTIFELRAKLAMGYRHVIPDSLVKVLERIEETQKRIEEKND